MKFLIIVFFFNTIVYAEGSKTDNVEMSIPSGVESYDCGTYLISGKIIENKSGKTVLAVYSGTSRSYMITISGVRVGDALLYDKMFVQMRLDVSLPGRGGLAKFKLVDSLKSITQSEALKTPIVVIAKKDCSK